MEWQNCLRAEYQPIIYIKRITPKHPIPDTSLHTYGNDAQEQEISTAHTRALTAAVRKAAAYMTKSNQPPDYPTNAGTPQREDGDDNWFLVYVEQVHKTRAFAAGGILKYFLQVATKRTHQDVVQLQGAKAGGQLFTWRSQARRYRRREPVAPRTLSDGRRRSLQAA